MRIVACLLMSTVVFIPASAFADPAGDSSVVDGDRSIWSVVERALPFIQREGEQWIEAKQCDSCHQVPFMVWSLNAAADRGLAVDAAKLQSVSDWARDWRSIRGREQAKEEDKEQALESGADELAQFLLGRRADERSVIWSTPEADSQAMRQRLLKIQQGDGSWKPGGQLPSQKRPLRETQEVTTLWAVLAVSSYGEVAAEDRAALERAAAWLGTATIGESTEWWAARLLWEQSRGNAEGLKRLRSGLLDRQKPDGGWGWLLAEESDALGTGIALYALARSGAAEDPAVGRAIAFLRTTQSDDGSWPVRGTKQSKRERVEATATFWGACWAVIGLTETMAPR
jgi:hypothetical protein